MTTVKGKCVSQMEPDDHALGHRDRLRARFREAGGNALADYEMLELVLFRALPRGDVKPLAKRLIKTFGSFADVVSASPERLAEVAGAGTRVVDEIKIIEAGLVRLARTKLDNRPLISSWPLLISYLQTVMGRSAVEEFRILYLDTKNKLIADEVQQTGTIDRIYVEPREIAKRTVALDAAAIILAHNHPSGDPTPSKMDVEMTQKIVDVLTSFEAKVHDHVIVARGRYTSFKQVGLLQKPTGGRR